MQDSIGAIIIIVVLWLVVKLAFGGSASHSSGQGASSQGGRASAGAGSKETAAAQAWRESKDDRQAQLKKRKQEMIESARR
ncbi:hypothetical protein CBS101457_005908 [Exobasidium rhododendri]|nr:hypothetical protein CBS101457_005908 [Exobasidium rhododendri]